MSATFPGPAEPPERLVWAYAGFWWRVLAWLLDSVILALADALVGLATGLRQVGIHMEPSGDEPATAAAFTPAALHSVQFPMPGHLHVHGGGLSLLSLLLAIAYFVLLESSRWQATVGKRVCRLRVTDLAGRRIGVGRALGRYAGKFVSALLLGIGFLMVGWTRHKQGLHDLMAHTLVMRLRPADAVFAFQPPAAP